VDPDRLNFFQPFARLAPNHENQLTRALLVVLRMSPLAHEYWLQRIHVGRRLAELPEPQFVTQTRAIAIDSEPDEPVLLISVFLAPAASFDEDSVLAESDRGQVLDAVITYPGELVVVVENKVAESDSWQAENINISGAAVKIAEGQKPVAVLWPELLADFTAMLERNLVAGTEAQVLSDFLIFVEDHFPGLGPYLTLGLCARNPLRVALRARTLLAEALGTDAWLDRWGTCAELPKKLIGTSLRAYLNPSDDMTEIELAVYPADTLGLAREFYTQPSVVEGARRLSREDGWQVRHNFHFGHMQGGYAWTSGDIKIDDYLNLWLEEINHASNIPTEEWPEYYDWLIEKGIAIPEDRAEFDKRFTSTDRSTATPRPGISVARQWQMTEAETLDATGSFDLELRQAVDRMHAELGK
jgi:hypothetical protein